MSNPVELGRLVEALDDQQWYEFLDALDEVSRRRRQQRVVSELPPDLTREGVAQWLAQKHFLSDHSIREIWHLPHNAPANESRFVEVSDFPAPPGTTRLSAVDFGLDVEGCEFRLFVVDVTSEQWKQVQEGVLALPKGWTLDGAAVWRRAV